MDNAKINEYVFIETSKTSNGKGANVKLYSKNKFMDGKIFVYDKRLLQVSKIDGNSSKALFELSLDEFEEIFSAYDIEQLQKNKELNYYPEGRYKRKNGYKNNSNTDRYPIYKKEIYVKYGQAIKPEKVNW